MSGADISPSEIIPALRAKYQEMREAPPTRAGLRGSLYGSIPPPVRLAIALTPLIGVGQRSLSLHLLALLQGALTRMLLCQVMADDAAAKGAEDCVMPGEMSGHAAHRGSLETAPRLSRADSRASRQDSGGESRWDQHCSHDGFLL